MRKCFPVLLVVLAAFPWLAWAGEEKTLLVDNFESDAPKLGKSWEIYADSNGLGSMANPFTLVKEGSPPESKGHGHFSGHVGKSKTPFPWIVLELEFFDDGPKDVSAFNSLRFRAKGDGKKHRVRIAREANEDYCYFEYTFTAPKEWTQVVAPFSEFTQPKWGKQIPAGFKDVTKISFQALAPGNDEDFELRFTDLEFATSRPAKDKK